MDAVYLNMAWSIVGLIWGYVSAELYLMVNDERHRRMRRWT